MLETEKPPDPPGGPPGGQLGGAGSGDGGGDVTTESLGVPATSGHGGSVATDADGQAEKPTYASLTAAPGQKSATAAPAVGGLTGGRSWKQIVEDAKTKNILQINIIKSSKIVDNETVKPRNLRHDDIANFIYDVLQVKHEDCIAIDFNTGRYDTRELQLKSDIDPTRFLRVDPVDFMDHKITVSALKNKSTRVTFRNVPLNVPDEELLHLAYHYGKPVNDVVTREVLTNVKSRGIKGSARYIDMNLDDGKTLENYYWMEGPLPGDRGRRILVTHPGQVPQCSHCLRRSGQGCPAAGNGSNCDKAGTKRALMKDYMYQLRMKTGYVSLKYREAEKLAKSSPLAEERVDLASAVPLPRSRMCISRNHELLVF